MFIFNFLFGYDNLEALYGITKILLLHTLVSNICVWL